MQKQPLFIVTICLILGIVFREWVFIEIVFAFILLIFSLLMVLVSFYKSLKIIRFRPVFLCFLFFILGIFLHSFNTRITENQVFEGKQNIVFKVDKKLNSNEKNKRYEVSFWVNEKPNKAVFSYPKTYQDFDFQHYYKAEVYINPTKPAEHSYQFDYAKYLARRQIFYQIYSSDEVEISPRNDLSFSEKIAQKRFEVLKKIDNLSISDKSRNFMKGIVLADRTEMDAEVTRDFQKSGLIHLLAISGTHIGIIFAFFLFVFQRFLPFRWHRYAIFISLIFIWLFAIFIGFGNSVVRSCVMLTAYFISVMLQRKPDLLHAMALAGLLILSVDTHQLYDVGFQLSFIAVLGIYWLNSPILSLFPKLWRRKKITRFFINIFSVTLAAQFATLPLILYYFHQFSLVSFVSNLVVIPFAQIIIIFSLLMAVFTAFDGISDWLYSLYDGLISWFADFQVVFIDKIPMTFLEILVLFMMIYSLRFVFLKFNSKNIFNFIYLSLFFILIKIGLDVYQYHKNETLSHFYFDKEIISVKTKDKVLFLVPNDVDLEKVKSYIINPYLVSVREKEVEIKVLSSENIDVKMIK
ncbi:MAG: ComEC/Rec2 family competence protein [Bergeyella zoohelcum]|nr:ComEC/Rec2 family competence protein [Bergeyella zoohelcum]